MSKLKEFLDKKKEEDFFFDYYTFDELIELEEANYLKLREQCKGLFEYEYFIDFKGLVQSKIENGYLIKIDDDTYVTSFNYDKIESDLEKLKEQ